MREIITFIPQVLMALGYMLYSRGSINTFFKALFIIIIIQFVIWGFKSLYEWAAYLLIRKKRLVKFFYSQLSCNKLPRIFSAEGPEEVPVWQTEPETYLYWIAEDDAGRQFDPDVRVVATGFCAEFRCQEALGELQLLARQKMALKAALEMYHNQKEVGDLWEVVSAGGIYNTITPANNI